MFSVPIRWGSHSSSAVAAVRPTHRTKRTSASWASDSGRRRISPTAWKEPSSISPRARWVRRARRATTITRAIIALPTRELSWFQSTPWWRIPKATDDHRTVGRWVSRPIIRAASARSSSPNPRSPPIGRPITPALRNRARKASAPASAHTRVWTALIGIPSEAARSGRSAVARMAIPRSVHRNRAPIAARTTGVSTSTRRWLAFSRMGPTSHTASMGTLMRCDDTRASHHLGISRARKVSA